MNIEKRRYSKMTELLAESYVTVSLQNKEIVELRDAVDELSKRSSELFRRARMLKEEAYVLEDLSRRVNCAHCGDELFRYNHISEREKGESARAKAAFLKHQKVCKKNPLTAENKALKEEIVALKKKLSRKAKKKTEHLFIKEKG